MHPLSDRYKNINETIEFLEGYCNDGDNYGEKTTFSVKSSELSLLISLLETDTARPEIVEIDCDDGLTAEDASLIKQVDIPVLRFVNLKKLTHANAIRVLRYGGNVLLFSSLPVHDRSLLLDCMERSRKEWGCKFSGFCKTSEYLDSLELKILSRCPCPEICISHYTAFSDEPIHFPGSLERKSWDLRRLTDISPSTLSKLLETHPVSINLSGLNSINRNQGLLIASAPCDVILKESERRRPHRHSKLTVGDLEKLDEWGTNNSLAKKMLLRLLERCVTVSRHAWFRIPEIIGASDDVDFASLQTLSNAGPNISRLRCKSMRLGAIAKFDKYQAKKVLRFKGFELIIDSPSVDKDALDILRGFRGKFSICGEPAKDRVRAALVRRYFSTTTTRSYKPADFSDFTSISKSGVREFGRALEYHKELDFSWLRVADAPVVFELVKLGKQLVLSGLESIDHESMQLLIESGRKVSLTGLRDLPALPLINEILASGMNVTLNPKFKIAGHLSLRNFVDTLQGVKFPIASDPPPRKSHTEAIVDEWGIESLLGRLLSESESPEPKPCSAFQVGWMERLSESDARIMSGNNFRFISFPDVREIDLEALDALKDSVGEVIAFDGVKSIDVHIAQKMAELNCRFLCLRGIEAIGPDAAICIGKFQGDLVISKEISAIVSRHRVLSQQYISKVVQPELLRASKCLSVEVNGFKEFGPGAADLLKSLFERVVDPCTAAMGGSISLLLNSLETLDLVSARTIASCHLSSLSVSGNLDISPELIDSFANSSIGSLRLSVAHGASRALIASIAKLSSDHLELAEVEILSPFMLDTIPVFKCKSISFPDLRVMDPWAGQKISEFKGDFVEFGPYVEFTPDIVESLMECRPLLVFSRSSLHNNSFRLALGNLAHCGSFSRDSFELPGVDFVVDSRLINRWPSLFRDGNCLFPRLSPDGAECLAGLKVERLGLDSLVDLDVPTAIELARFRGSELSLLNLRNMDIQVARALSSFRGTRISLSFVDSSHKDLLRELSRSNDSLYSFMNSL